MIKRIVARIAAVIALAGIGIIAMATAVSAGPIPPYTYSDLRLKKNVRVAGAPLSRR